MAHSTGIPPKLARCVMVYIIPSGMMPDPVGVSVAIRKRSNCCACFTISHNISVVRKFPAVQTWSAICDSCTIFGKSSSGIATGPPLT